jgi:hypothetical protein
MPLVLQRNSSRPEDDVMLRMAQEVVRQRSRRLVGNSTTAAEIEHRQKAKYEELTRRPFLPRPKPEPGYSQPQWDAVRASWASDLLADSRKWVVWNAYQEKWVDLETFDRGTSVSDLTSESN